jgi:ABC-2 type transport system ATP-binding protein
LKRKASAADAAGPLQAGDAADAQAADAQAADAQAADAQAADAQAAAAERASAAGATQVDGLAPGDQGSGNDASSSHFVSSFGRGETALVLARKAAGELRQLQAMRAKLEKALAREKEKRETSR